MNVNLKKANDYSSALKIRRSLCARRAQITPSYTKEYWEDIVIEYSKNLSIVEENLQLVQKAYDEIDRELSACKSDIGKLLGSVNKFNEINNTAKATKSNFDKANKNHKQILLKCKEEIEILINAGRGVISYNDEKSILENAKDIMHQMDIIANDVTGKDKEDISLKLSDTRKEIYKTENEIREVQELINNLEKEAIMKAQNVGATLTTAYLNDVLQERGFDTVILDEASMAQIPALWCASYAAKNNIVIVGDFLQLPPIVMANTPMAQKWLKRDVFAASGIQESAKKGNVSPDNFIMLDKQYRMETAIDNEYELKCPICSGNLFLGEADKGGFYWKCTACGYSRSMDQQYPVDGILRCHCGSTYHFDMKNQPRWVCDENRKHYQKMRYGDLKLKNMKALLSDNDLKRVESYFAGMEKEESNTSKKEKTRKQALKKEEVINKTTSQKKNNIEGQITLADLGLM